MRPAKSGDTTWAGNIQAITAADLQGDGMTDVLAYVWPHAAAGGRADLFTGVNEGTCRIYFRPALPPGRLQELALRYGSIIVENSAGYAAIGKARIEADQIAVVLGDHSTITVSFELHIAQEGHPQNHIVSPAKVFHIVSDDLSAVA